MKFKHVIGLDMAKDSFSLSVHNHAFEQDFENTARSIRKMLKTLSKELGLPLDQCLFALEHTGLYSYEIMKILSSQKLAYTVIAGLALKKSLGISRGKDDQIDARRIAQYAHLRQDHLKLYQLPSQELLCLKDLLSLRAKHVRTRAGYIARVNEQKRILKRKDNRLLFHSQEKLIKVLNKEIQQIEKEIEKLINDNEKIKYYYDLISSIKGVGMIVAAMIIVKTNCFSSFSNWRKFACYIGTAPFPNRSGKMKKNNRISKYGDKEMKRLMTLAAQSAILYDPQIKSFYQRKLKAGKSKKNTRNAVRNKLLSRIFSVAKRGTPYVVLHNIAA